MHNKILTPKITKTYNGLDLAKFLSALLILFYHAFSEHGPLHPLFADFLSLYAVAVALFMTISGFLTYSKLQSISDFCERRSVVLKQTKRILTVYIAWSIPYLIYQICCWDWANISLKFILLQLRTWVFSSTFYTIWFLPSLAFGLLLSFYITEKLPLWCQIFIGIILYLLSALSLSYLFLGSKLPFFNGFSQILNTYLGGARGWLTFATPLLMLGKFIVKIRDKTSLTLSFFLSLLSMAFVLAEALILRRFVGGTGIDTIFSMIPAVVFITIFCLKLSLPQGAAFIWMRKMSVLIFVTQRIFLTVIPSLLPLSVLEVIFYNNYLGVALLCGLTIAFSAFIIFLSGKFTILKKIY